MKAIIKVGLDLGASRVKFSFNKGAELFDDYFHNRVDTAITASGIKVDIDGQVVTVGTVSGYSNSVNKKVNYKNIDHILFAVAYMIKTRLELVEDTIRLDINTVLPPTEYKESREAYKELIKSVSGKTATVDGKDTFTLIIEDVKVGSEGIVLLKACDFGKIAKDLTQVLLLEVGSSTTEIVVLVKSENSWKIKYAESSTIAGKTICKAIETGLNTTVTGASFKWDNLEISQGYELDGIKHGITENMAFADDTVTALIGQIREILFVREYKVILAGAGSRLLRESEVFKAYTKFSCIDDSLLDYGNSRGALKA